MQQIFVRPFDLSWRDVHGGGSHWLYGPQRAAGVSALSGRPAASGNSLRSGLWDDGGLGRTEGKTGAFFSGFVSAGNHGGWGFPGDVDSPSEEPVMEIFFCMFLQHIAGG